MASPSLNLDFEDRVQQTAREIFSLIGGEKPSVFQQDYWSGRVMEWALRNPDFKTQMFRFVDVLPSLGSSKSVARHVREYFGEDGLELGGAMKWGLRALDSGGKLGAKVVSKGIDSQVRSLAGQFIVGEEIRGARGVLKDLRKKGFASTISLLGEVVVSEREADEFAQRYLTTIRDLSEAAARWPALGGEGALDWGAAPRVNVSIKPSSLYSQLRPQAFDASVDAAVQRLKVICREAIARDVSICLDMEHRELKSLTLAVYRKLLEDPDIAGWPHSGLAIQTYLRETRAELEDLLEWSRAREQPFTIRLIKGAYWDAELVEAGQHNWPAPVWLDKAETDVAFEDAASLILDTAPHVRLACGSHNARSIAYVHEKGQTLGVPGGRIEYQVLYGMADPIANALAKLDMPVRMYAPVGELLPGMAYLVRRLLENTSNESFLRRSFAEGVSVDREVRDPRKQLPAESPQLPAKEGFTNEPPLDWTLPEVRARFAEALETVRARFPIAVAPVIAGRRRETPETFVSRNPNDTAELVANASAADEALAAEAVQAAREAFPAWRATPPAERAAILRRAAEEARKQRHELAALQVFEAGKAWAEADGDVCEAIDFLEYYAHQMLRLGEPRKMGDAPGEDSVLVYEPRGVAAVIAPWNFPLAISTGMSSAALVTGNTVVYKPASETAAIAAGLYDILERAGLPPGVFNLLPGSGAEAGRALVGHPDVRTIAFTGSREVGLEIVRRAADVQPGARWIKHVIAEMGGKNAIVIDDDADLDAAATAVVQSAFGYQGQKCSACSRLILLDSIHDAFLERLRDAVDSLPMGPVENPHNVVGAVISEAAQQKVQRYVELGRSELRTVVKRRHEGGSGYYAPLAVFADVPPNHALAQEEIFGPVLSVLRAKDFDHALEIAVDTDYALTGAVFTRSPANLEKAREAFRVGNLYINRGSTGAIVERHPFGGFQMSGLGSKAGGPDYLQQFVIPRSIVENTTRRGFTPGIG